MKVFSAEQIFRIEEESEVSFNISADMLMKEACSAITNFILEETRKNTLPSGKILIIVGKGNNGGDGWLCACNLLSLGFDVDVLALHSEEESSVLNRKYRKVFVGFSKNVINVSSLEKTEFSFYAIIIDAILGIGFKEKKEHFFYEEIIKKINVSSCSVVAIDIPSGLNASTGVTGGNAIVKADITLSLGYPKQGYFWEKCKDYVGMLYILPLSFPVEAVDKITANLYLLSQQQIKKYLPKHSLSAHKYEKGGVVGFGGTKSMKGALMLSCLATLHSGSGIVFGISALGSSLSLDSLPYEVIKKEFSFEGSDDIEIIDLLKKAKSVFIGPGLGLSYENIRLIEKVIVPSRLPVVFDADALNLYAQYNFLLPDHCIFTPHTGEMKRILKIKEHIILENLLEKAWNFSKEKKLIIVLKGTPTFIITPEKIFISSHGCLGLATAGSGDILTGVIASLIAQGLDIEKAACLGVFIHGLSGEKASRGVGNCFFKAGDFLPYISEILRDLHKKEELCRKSY